MAGELNGLNALMKVDSSDGQGAKRPECPMTVDSSDGQGAKRPECPMKVDSSDGQGAKRPECPHEGGQQRWPGS